MLQPTGSVYLDTPTRASRRPPTSRIGDTRAVLAGLLTMIGLMGLSATVVFAGLQTVILEPATVRDAFERTLDDPTTRAEITQELAVAIEDGLVGAEVSDAVAGFGVDVAGEAARVSEVVIDEPAVRTALADVVTELHSRAFIEPGDGEVDFGPLSAAVLAVIERDAPVLAGIVATDALLWTAEDDLVPDVHRAVDLLDRSRLAAILALAAIPLALVIHPNRHRIVAWLGTWSLAAGLVAGLVAVGFPVLAGEITGWKAVEVGIRSSSYRLIAPAAVAGIVGLGLTAVAAAAARRDVGRVSNEGAAAALGIDEPAPWERSAAPTIDLAARGLVDVNHPLTNI